MPATRTDIYASVTGRIVAALEQGVRPWLKPWNAEHAAGRITRPLRHNLQPYRGINVLVLWMEAEAKGFAAPIWLTFQQAKELGAHVRKGEHGSPVVYASSFTKAEAGEDGAEVEQEIHFLKQYTVFNVEQVEGLPAPFYARAEPVSEHDGANRRGRGLRRPHRGRHPLWRQPWRITPSAATTCSSPPFETFRDAESHAATLAHELTHWTQHAVPPRPLASRPNASATKGMRWKNWSPNSAPPFSVPISPSRPRCGKTTPPIWPTG